MCVWIYPKKRTSRGCQPSYTKPPHQLLDQPTPPLSLGDDLACSRVLVEWSLRLVRYHGGSRGKDGVNQLSLTGSRCRTLAVAFQSQAEGYAMTASSHGSPCRTNQECKCASKRGNLRCFQVPGIQFYANQSDNPCPFYPSIDPPLHPTRRAASIPMISWRP